ncbi:MAG: hypothetical protein ACP5G1_04910, partial [Nanopusillaceae archaeon]
MSNAASIYALITTLPKTSNYIFKYLDNEMRDLEKSIKWEIRVLFEKFKKNYNESISYRFISYRDMIEETSSIVNYLIELALLNELKEAAKQGPKGLEKYANILREHYEVLVSGGDPKKMENIANYAKEIVEKYINEATNLGYRINYSLAKLECTLNLVKYHDTVIKKIVKEKLGELNKEYYNVYEPY